MSLQAWYPFNGNYENLGLGDLDLNVTTSPVYTTGKVSSQGLNTGNFVWTANQSMKILNNRALSICFWLKPTASTSAGGGALFGQFVPNRRFCIFTYPNYTDLHLDWRYNDAGASFYNTVETGFFQVNQWTHCTITFEYPNSLKIYKNGELFKSITGKGTMNISDFAYETGFSFSNNRHINDFRVYDHCLSPKEVKEISKGLMLHYPLNNNGIGCENLDELYYQLGMDENIEYDTSGYGNNGSKIGTLDYESGSPRYNVSSYFNGINSGIYNIPTCLNSTSNDFSISFWYKPTAVTNGAIINCRNTMGEGISIFWLDQYLRFDTGLDAQWSTGKILSLNTWYHIVFTRNGSYKKLYVNGQLYGSSTTIGYLTTLGKYMSIGISSSDDADTIVNLANPLSGNLSDFRIYATCLSDSDIQELYNKPISIDNQGTLFVTGLNEEITNLVKFGKNGIVDIESINPSENISNKFKIYKNYIECGDIIEN